MKVIAFNRTLQGTGASRRLRRTGRVPGILYGGTATPQQIEDAETKDLPPPWRLACQFVVRSEDILVEF